MTKVESDVDQSSGGRDGGEGEAVGRTRWEAEKVAGMGVLQV